MPKVSVFVPNYNSEKYIRATIEAILNQTYTDLELIIVDDGSTDKSVEIIKEYALSDDRVKLYFNPGNKGVVYTRNRGIDLCQGEYIALCDADDICYPDRIEECVKLLDEKKFIDCVFGNTKAIKEDEYICENIISNKDETDSSDAKNKQKQVCSEFNEKCRLELVDSETGIEKESDRIKYEMLFGNEVSNSACMYRSEFRKRYDIRYRDYFCSQDYGFFCDFLAAGGNVVKLKRKLTAYRIMSDGITNKSLKRLEERWRIQDEIHENFLDACKIKLGDKLKKVYIKNVRAPYSRYESLLEGIVLLMAVIKIALSFKGKVPLLYKLKKSIGLWKNLRNMI